MASCLPRRNVRYRYVLCAFFIGLFAAQRWFSWQNDASFVENVSLDNSRPNKVELTTTPDPAKMRDLPLSKTKQKTEAESLHTSANTDNNKAKGSRYIRQMSESRFHLPERSLTTIGYPLRDFITLSDFTADYFVFVTAANQMFLSASHDLIGNVQDHFPSRKIIFYDLDVKPKDETQDYVSSLCNVEYRRFPFESFPNYVSKLKHYRFKPLIIHMVLQEYPGVYWVDSSVRFVTDDLSEVLNIALDTGGVVMPQSSGIANNYVTHPGMYRYLPTNVTKMAPVHHVCACTFLIYRTESIYRDVMRWLVLCALTRDCMAPPLSTHLCKRPFLPRGCHRYDQSALNILLFNKFDFDTSRYRAPTKNSKIQRKSAGKGRVKQCIISE